MTTGEAIALKPIVENLGLDWSSQLKRLKRDDQKSQLWSYQKFIADDKKSYDMVCMAPVNFQSWLWAFLPSENLNFDLLDFYKQGLVVHILLMLKVSLNEVQRLRAMEQDFSLMKDMVTEFITETVDAQNLNSQAKEKFRNAKKMREDLLDRMNGHNPDQTSLFLD